MAEVAIVGSGAVGVACAGSVLRQGIATRLVFYDRDGTTPTARRSTSST